MCCVRIFEPKLILWPFTSLEVSAYDLSIHAIHQKIKNGWIKTYLNVRIEKSTKVKVGPSGISGQNYVQQSRFEKI